MLTNKATVAQGRTGGERASANRSIRPIPERHLYRRDPPGTLPGWWAVIRAAAAGPRAATYSNSRRTLNGAMGAEGAEERLQDPVHAT